MKTANPFHFETALRQPTTIYEKAEKEVLVKRVTWSESTNSLASLIYQRAEDLMEVINKSLSIL